MSNNQSRVAILLSTFNGEKFLPEQLDSLYAQEHTDFHIYLRDDGSSDGTLAIARQYARERGRMHVVAGPNLGYANSFFELLRQAGDGYDCYFFCDQDDVWLPSKVRAAVQMLAQHGLLGLAQSAPGMYFSKTAYVDEKLCALGLSPDFADEQLGFGNALVQNVVSGCTMALNRPARELLVAQLPRQCLGHDWWTYLVVSAFGRVVFDRHSHVLYRQHGANTLGMLQEGWARQWLRVRRLLAHKGLGILNQLSEFERLYGELLDDRRRRQVLKLLQSRQSLRKGLCVALQGYYWRMRWTDSLMVRVLLLWRKY